MKKNPSKGLKGSIMSLIFFIIATALAVALIKSNDIHNAKDLYNYAYKKSQDIKYCLNPDKPTNCSGFFNPEMPDDGRGIESPEGKGKLGSIKEQFDKRGNNSNKSKGSLESRFPDLFRHNNENFNINPSKENIEKYKSLLNNIEIKENPKVNYNRKEWKHWSYRDRSCWNVREETLYLDAEKGTQKLLDKAKQPTKDVKEACYIIGGKWIDPYSGETITNPKGMDIDHLVPLGYAARHGGNNWSAEEKEKFANDKEVLISASAKENRSKSDKGPEAYMPPNNKYKCEYSLRYIHILSKYKLSMTSGDKATLQKTIQEYCR